MEEIINFGIFGKVGTGKCTLKNAIDLYLKNLVNLNDFIYNNIKYHLFPIPCCGTDYKENFEISIFNSDFIIITIDSEKLNYIKDDYEYYFYFILSSIYLGYTKIIIVFTKKDEIKEAPIDKAKSIFKDMFDVIKNRNEINDILFEEFINFINMDSIKGDDIDKLLNLFPTCTRNIYNQNNLIMNIFDKYTDNDKNEFVMTGKILNGGITENKIQIKVNETNLQCNYINDSLKKLEINNNMKLEKFCLADGKYLETLNNFKQGFITLKFNLKELNNEFVNNVNKNIIVTKDNSNDICYFDTFEADITICDFQLITENKSTENITVFSKGVKCLFYNYNTTIGCNIVNIMGEFKNKNEIEKKKLITNCKNGIKIKLALNLEKPILATKYEICQRFGTFFLIKDNNIFAIGKINKYKPIK